MSDGKIILVGDKNTLITKEILQGLIQEGPKPTAIFLESRVARITRRLETKFEYLKKYGLASLILSLGKFNNEPYFDTSENNQVHKLAKSNKIPIHLFDNPKSGEFLAHIFSIKDCLVVLAEPSILSKDLIAATRGKIILGNREPTTNRVTVNGLVWSILNKKTIGTSTIVINGNSAFDVVFSSKELAVCPTDTFEELQRRLEHLTAENILNNIRDKFADAKPLRPDEINLTDNTNSIVSFEMIKRAIGTIEAK